MKFPPLSDGSPVSLGKRKRQSNSPGLAPSVPGHHVWQNPDLSRLVNIDPDVGKRPRLSGPDLPQGANLGQSSNKMLLHLPSEILQHIFCHVDPVALGRLIHVNRLFRSLLDPAVSLPQPSGVDKVVGLRLRKQDLVWAISRKTFCTGFPRPLEGMTEIAMWRLIRGTLCFFCNTSPSRPHHSVVLAPWDAGPGKDSVRTIWPFRVRACTSCLKPRLIKDTTLLMSSSSASTLRAGLPFAIFTSNWDYVLGTSLQNADPPPNLQLIKYYFLPQVDELQNQLQYVQTLGLAATEEWYKGLEDRGSHLNSDAARFEKCELQGTFTRLSQSRSQIHCPLSAAPEAVQNPISVTLPTHKQIPAGSSGLTDPRLFAPTKTQDRIVTVPSEAVKIEPLQPHPTVPQSPTSASDSSLLPLPRSRPGRSLHEAEQAQAERRAEIERRCQAMIPPISQSTLPFMDAFQAAIKIARALTDNDWKILEPRLLAQRIAAQHKETIQVTPGSNAEEQLRQQQLEEEQQVAQENENNMWSELNVSSRDRITRHAQKFIQQTWLGGVRKATSSTFAAEVLCYVRQRFDDEIAEEDKMLTMKGTAFPHTPESLANRRLTLEDMKWAFEEFVKPHTDKYGKDLFLCRDCDNSQKLFPFEGVIQHYAAKHTHSFSRGSAVVYWKAEWPSEPPFDPNPNIPWVQNASDSLTHPRANIVPTAKAWTAPKSSAPRSTSSQETTSNELVLMIKDVWLRTDGVWNLPHSLRLYVVIQIAGKRFSQRFNEDLGFHFFLHCVQSRPELYFLHTLSGLHCKICASQPDLSISQAVPPPRNFGLSFTGLLMHFQKIHMDMDASSSGNGYGLVSPPWTMSSASGRLDWKRDMVMLPHENEVQDILRSPSTDPTKLQLISEALNSPAYASTIVAGPRSVLSSSERPILPPRHSNYGEHPRALPARGPLPFSVHEASGAPSVPSAPSLHPSEDEYDPHRPAPQPPAYERLPPSGPGRMYPIAGHHVVGQGSQVESFRTSPRGWLGSHEKPYYRDVKGQGSNDGSVNDLTHGRSTQAVHGRAVSIASGGESRPMHVSTGSAAASLPRGSPRASGTGAGMSTAAVDFLNNFDKTAAKDLEEFERSSNVPGVRYFGGDDGRAPEARILEAAHETTNVAQEGNAVREGYVYARPLTPSLPIRPREVHRWLPSNHDRVESASRPREVREDSSFDGQGTALTGSYQSDRPERIHRIERQEPRMYPIAPRYYEVLEEEVHPRRERQGMRESRFEALDRSPRAWYDDQGQAIASGRERVLGPEFGTRLAGHEYYGQNQDRVRYVELDTRTMDTGIYDGGLVYSAPLREQRMTYPEYDDTRYISEASLETSQAVRVHHRNYSGHEQTFMDNERRHPASQG